jgi:hypothetical protein
MNMIKGIIMKKLTIALLFLLSNLAYADAPKSVALNLVNIPDFHLENIQPSNSNGRIYVSQQTVCLPTVLATQNYNVTILPEGTAESEYALTNGTKALPIHFWWGTEGSANSFAGMVELLPGHAQFIENSGQSGSCGNGSSAQLKLTLNGTEMRNNTAGHYLERFNVMITPLLK